jgi:hypothetical protein
MAGALKWRRVGEFQNTVSSVQILLLLVPRLLPVNFGGHFTQTACTEKFPTFTVVVIKSATVSCIDLRHACCNSPTQAHQTLYGCAETKLRTCSLH